MFIFDLIDLIFTAITNIPILSFVYFIGSLVFFIVAKVKNRKTPESVSKKALKTIVVNLIISGIIFFLIVAVFITLVLMVTFGAITFM